MKPITATQLDTLIKPKQHFHDCYLVAGLSALAKNKNGRKILQENILTDGSAYCIKFNNVKGRQEQYLVRQEECDNLILTDEFLEVIPVTEPHNPIIKAVEVAMNKLLKVHPDKKPYISRIPKCIEAFEYNRPSNFMEMFTGIRPITMNERSFKNNFKNQKDDMENLLNVISQSDNSVFILGTGYLDFDKTLTSWHCYNIEKIDNSSKKVFVRDNKTGIDIRLTYNYIADKCKFICGYFDESFI